MDIFIPVGAFMLALTGVAAILFAFTRTDSSIELQVEPLISIGTVINTFSILIAIAGTAIITYAYFNNKDEAYGKKWKNTFKPLLDIQTEHVGIKRLMLNIEMAIISKNNLVLDKYEGDLLPELLALDRCIELEGQVGEDEIKVVYDKAITSIMDYVKETEEALVKNLDLDKEHLDLVSSRRNNNEQYLAPLAVATVTTVDTMQTDCSSSSVSDSNCSN